jgi:peptidoglycan/LPS O-acetylase OafA/YrhL
MCLCFRVKVATTQPFDPYSVWQTQCRLDGLFFGVFLAYAYEFHREKFLAIASKRKLLFILATLLLLPLAILRFRTQPIVVTVGITMAYIAYGMLLVALMGVHRDEQGVLPRVLFSRPMKAIAWMGTFSYCIYLFHLDLPHRIGMLVADMNGILRLPREERWFISMAVYFCLAILIGVIATKVIELPMLSFRNKRFPEDSSPLTTDTGTDLSR